MNDGAQVTLNRRGGFEMHVDDVTSLIVPYGIAAVAWALFGAALSLPSRYRRWAWLREIRTFGAKLKAERDNRPDKRPTMVEALQDELDMRQRIAVRPVTGEEPWYKTSNPILAKHQLNDDLGQYAEGPHEYNLDQGRRDILLAHARRDAAEALANTRSLLEEVKKLTDALSGFHKLVFWVTGVPFIVLFVKWWTTGSLW
jgi:hypothetical protein